MVDEKKEKLYLLTGLPRSGTTWIGEKIGQSNNVDYIFEPFSIRYHPNYDNSKKLRDIISNYLPDAEKLSDKWIYDNSDLNEFFDEFRNHVVRLKNHYFQGSNRPLLFKQPMSVKLKWFLDVVKPEKVVFIYRHPGGVLDSFKRYGLLKDFVSREFDLAINDSKVKESKYYDYRYLVKNKYDKFAFLYFLKINIVFSYLNNYNSKVVKYEDFVDNQLKTIVSINDFLELPQDIVPGSENIKFQQRAGHLNLNQNSNQKKIDWYYKLSPKMINSLIKFSELFECSDWEYPGLGMQKRTVFEKTKSIIHQKCL